MEVSVGESIDADVDVGLGGSAEEVAEERFEDEGVGAVVVHVGGVGVAEAVRGEVVEDPDYGVSFAWKISPPVPASRSK